MHKMPADNTYRSGHTQNTQARYQLPVTRGGADTEHTFNILDVSLYAAHHDDSLLAVLEHSRDSGKSARHG